MYTFSFVSKVYTKMEVKKNEMKDKNDNTSHNLFIVQWPLL